MLMATVHCPRCKEPFEASGRFCRHCGIRRGRPEGYRWLLVVVGCAIVIVGLSIGMQHIFSPFKVFTPGIADALFCFGPVLSVVLLLLPLPYWYFTYQLALLRKRGITTRGKVIQNKTQMVGRHGDIPRFVSVVEFEADLNPSFTCRTECSSLFKGKGRLLIGSEVDVVYDPYGPRWNARIGRKPSLGRLMVRLFFCVILSCLLGGLAFSLIFF